MVIAKYGVPRVFDHLVDEFLNGQASHYGTGVFHGNSVPAVNIQEHENAYLLELNAPGLNKEDFKINLENNLLTIAFEKKSESDEKGPKFIKREFVQKNFKRAFNLDEKINGEGIEAKYEAGILKVTLPKKAETKVLPKEIAIL